MSNTRRFPNSLGMSQYIGNSIFFFIQPDKSVDSMKYRLVNGFRQFIFLKKFLAQQLAIGKRTA
jgi:hypothetical protein